MSSPSASDRDDEKSPTDSSSVKGLLPRLRARARRLRGRLTKEGDSRLFDRLRDIDEQFVAEGARDVTDTDIETVVEKANKIEERFHEGGPLHRLVRDGRLLLALVRDTYEGRYRAVPLWTLSAAAFTLLYVLNPFDLIPDAIPVFGLLDDAAVVSACLVLIEQDLHEYDRWREETGRNHIDGEGEGTESQHLTSR